MSFLDVNVHVFVVCVTRVCVCVCVCVCRVYCRVGVRDSVLSPCHIAPSPYSSTRASQLLRMVLRCAKQCQRTRTCPRRSPYLSMELRAIFMHAFAASD